MITFAIGAAVFISTWFRPDGQLGSTEIGQQFADLFLRGISRTRSSQATVRSRGTRARTEREAASPSAP